MQKQVFLTDLINNAAVPLQAQLDEDISVLASKCDVKNDGF